MAERNADVPADRRIELRMGINLGDIIRDGRDIYGDGVNIAARLEALAEPGAVFVSNNVYEHVRDRLSVAFEDLGEQQVKNIARPVHVYRVLDPKLAVAQDNLGLVYWDQDKPEMAIAEYQTAIQLDPKDALPHNNLGNILYSEQGKPEMAISELKTAIYIDPKLLGSRPKGVRGLQ